MCGNEIIAKSQQTPIMFMLPEPAQGFFESDVSLLFNNSDNRCPISDFSVLSESKGELSADAKKMIQLVGKNLKINKSVVGKLNFYVQATSVGDVKETVQFTVDIEKKKV